MSDIHKLQNNRPLSPHLSIYKPQLTSILSILHRITGAFLYCGIVILSWVIFSLVYFPYILENLSYFIQSSFFTTVTYKLLILGWCFSLFYHLFNGIRHLFWDIGKGFSLEETYRSGKIVVILSIILTFSCWIIASNATNESIITDETATEVQN